MAKAEILDKTMWIGGGNLLRKQFEYCADGKAMLIITGVGFYKAYINGKKVGDIELAPSYTNYKMTIEYNVFDVTKYLQNGNNEITVHLGAHFNNDQKQRARFLPFYSGENMAIAQLCDNSGVIVQTDKSWRVDNSQIIESSIYDGEIFDSNVKEKNYNDCKNAVIIKNDAKLVESYIPSIKVMKTYKAKIIRKTSDVIIYDFGTNISGKVRIKGEAVCGEQIIIRHAENVFDDGSLNTGSLRSAKACDKYIASGGKFEYSPSFTYHGFRYASITVNCNLTSVEALETRTSCNKISGFKSSNKKLNKIAKIMVQTFANNLMSIPTDCHQRDERQGWIADAHLALDSELCAFDVKLFYKKFLNDIAETIEPDGNITAFTAPMLYGGESLMWTGGYYMILYKLYKETNDINIVKTHYDNLCKYFDCLIKHEQDSLLTIGGLGDWLALHATKEAHIRDATYKDFADKMAYFSNELGLFKKAKFYKDKSELIKTAYNKKYYSPHESNEMSGVSSGYYGTCDEIGQLPNALAICFDIAPSAEKDKIIDRLVYDICKARKMPQLTTGLIGTKYIFEALAKIGRNDIALDLLLRKDYPSWNFMLDCGATTVWERWEYMTDNEMNSHCHTPLATPYYWIIRHLLGISSPFKDERGNVVFNVKPYYDSRLTFYSGYLITDYGKIEVSISKTEEGFKTDITVPNNCKYNLF